MPYVFELCDSFSLRPLKKTSSCCNSDVSVWIRPSFSPYYLNRHTQSLQHSNSGVSVQMLSTFSASGLVMTRYPYSQCFKYISYNYSGTSLLPVLSGPGDGLKSSLQPNHWVFLAQCAKHSIYSNSNISVWMLSSFPVFLCRWLQVIPTAIHRLFHAVSVWMPSAVSAWPSDNLIIIISLYSHAHFPQRCCVDLYLIEYISWCCLWPRDDPQLFLRPCRLVLMWITSGIDVRFWPGDDPQLTLVPALTLYLLSSMKNRRLWPRGDSDGPPHEVWTREAIWLAGQRES